MLNSKRTTQSASFGLEERFDPDRRAMLACVTPGPGQYESSVELSEPLVKRSFNITIG